MVELVDTRDLKSLGHNGCAGSSPARATCKNRRAQKFSNLRFLDSEFAQHLHNEMFFDILS